MRTSALIALAVLAAACGDDTVERPPLSPDTGAPDVPVVLDTADPADDAAEDTGEPLPDVPDGPDAPDAVSPDVPKGPDAGPTVGDGSVGAGCFLDNHCDGDALCLDWSGGYCTLLNCPNVSQCPEGAACVGISGGATVCLQECETQSDCREGYGCKPFVDVAGVVRRGCVGLSEAPAPVGGPCGEHSDCDGAFACLSFVPEGYCALIGCSADAPCPEGSACVTYNGQPTCLAACAIDEDCLASGAEQRTCGPLLDVQSKVAQVCIPSTEGVGVGSQCTTDVECESSECRIVAEGKCVGSPQGCFTDDDCPGANVCEVAPAYLKGVCTQACAADLGCPGNAQCVSGTDGLAWCNLPCKGASDKTTCDADVGETCVFGDPVGDTTGAGKYACANLKSGDPGTPCDSAEACKDGSLCVGAPGTCAPPCGAGLACPFPTTCVDHLGEPRCLRRCFSPLDCPGTLSCVTGSTGVKICLP